MGRDIRIEPDWNVKVAALRDASALPAIRIEPDWNVKLIFISTYSPTIS